MLASTGRSMHTHTCTNTDTHTCTNAHTCQHTQTHVYTQFYLGLRGKESVFQYTPSLHHDKEPFPSLC